jgi:hypothetical protein
MYYEKRHACCKHCCFGYLDATVKDLHVSERNGNFFADHVLLPSVHLIQELNERTLVSDQTNTHFH